MDEKYISASKLKAHYSWLGKGATLLPKDVDDIIDAQPAADVEPVVRGEWEKRELNFGAFYRCSICGETISGFPMYKFCHACGAHMERSGNNDT